MIFVCPDCSAEYTSKFMFDKHMDLNSEENFLETFIKTAENEISKGRGRGVRQIIDTSLAPKLQQIRENRRAKGGYPNKKDKPVKNKHKNAR